MSIKDPISYGDLYWKQSTDALLFSSEEAEKSYTPVINDILDISNLRQFIPDAFKSYYNNLSAPAAGYWDGAQRVFGEFVTRAMNIAFGQEIMRPSNYKMRAVNQTLKIDADMAAILRQRLQMTDEDYRYYTNIAGYNDKENRQFYNSRIPYPAIPDIITASRYLGDATNPKPYAMSVFDIPEKDYPIWDWLSYQKLTTEQVQELFRRRVFTDDDTNRELARLGWHEYDGFMIKLLAHELPNPMLLAQGLLLQNANHEAILDGISEAGIKPGYDQTYFDAIMTKPATEDIVAYELRRDPSLSNLPTELRRIGIHPNYNSLYKELAYQIPPVADIITMAVREAFTPAIAARFGQYEDLPTEFVEWVQKKGLSKEWAERYWAAHWSLPSPQQGFEMLHRGVIGVDDLNMLMRALDIMPFWRDKLTQIAFRPLSRVDVRRMFALGVLDVGGVRKAYTDLGYNDYNANLMTNFTIKYTEGIETRSKEAKEKAAQREQEAKEKAAQKEREAQAKALIPKVSEWTTAQTLSFLKKGLIDEERAKLEFQLLGYNEERISVYLTSVVPAS